MNLQRILIANRGEIAVRIIRACRDTGRVAVVVYSDADAEAEHVRLADEALPLGGVSPAESYLDGEKIIALGVEAKVDAIHPGYGFLSESADFARAVVEAGLSWVGPSPESIDLLGDKVSARALAEEVGAPLVQGTEGEVDADQALEFAREHGLPVVIKAAHGGGGRGMRVAREEAEVVELFEAAAREATGAFGRGECFVEQFLDEPRHVEVQVLADAHGNVAALGTRDCSLQRRNQKLVEEAPAPGLTGEQRRRLLESAVDICARAEYQGAATVEFLLSQDGALSFLEVNTRLQVEHPVTEETTGLDLVAEQFRIAEGEALSGSVLAASERAASGAETSHSLEFRINAEDPGRGFLPSPGVISRFEAPAGPGVRVDAGYRSGDTLPGAYDSMLAKLIVTAPDRERALLRARRALAEFEVEGIATVLPFHRAVLEREEFTGDSLGVHTGWIEAELDFAPEAVAEPAEDSAVLRTWAELDGRRVELGLPASLLGALGGVGSEGGPGGEGGQGGPGSGADSGGAGEGTEEGAVVAPVAGTLSRWLVDDGDQVEQGQSVAVIEAMKMETTVSADSAGTLHQEAAAGKQVDAGQIVGRVGAGS